MMVQQVIKVIDDEACIQDDHACVCAVCCPNINTPVQVTLTVSGMADDTCTDCSDFNVSYVLDYVGVFGDALGNPPTDAYAECQYRLELEIEGETCNVCDDDGNDYVHGLLTIDFVIVNNGGNRDALVSFHYEVVCYDPISMETESIPQFDWEGVISLGTEESCLELPDQVFSSLTGSGSCDGSSATITIAAVA